MPRLCANEYESSEVMILRVRVSVTPVFIPWLCQLCSPDCLRRSRSFLAPVLQSVSQGPSPKRPTELVNAMITSNSGCDLRPPVDTYAFKCEAKQCSLEVALTASCCAAGAFLQTNWDLHLRVLLIHTQWGTRFEVLSVPQELCRTCLKILKYFRKQSRDL